MKTRSTGNTPTAPLWGITSVKRTLPAVMVTGLLLFTTACGTAEAEPDKVRSTPSVTKSVDAGQSAPAASESDAPGKDTVDKDEIVASLVADGLKPNGASLSNKNGSWAQVEFTDDAHVLGTPVTELPEGWTNQDAADATELAMNFLVQDIIDTPLNGDWSEDAKAGWVKDSAIKLMPSMREEFIPYFIGGTSGVDESIVMDNGYWQTDEDYTFHAGDPSYASVNYGYVYEEDTPRLKGMDIGIDTVSVDEFNALRLEFSGTYTFVATSDLGVHDEVGEIEGYIAVIKDNGALFISGVSTDAHTNPPKLKN
jgi:hypothetical protein